MTLCHEWRWGGVFGKHSVWISKRTFGEFPKPPLCVNVDILSR